MRKDELLSTIVVWLANSGVTWALLRWDHGRLDEKQRSRAWYDSTRYVALSGLFCPPPLAFGAHLWVTRSLPLWQRLPLALLGAAAAMTLAMTVAVLALTALGIEV